MTSPLVDRLNGILKQELAAINSLDGAIARQELPDYTMLYHESKVGHQTSAGQLTTLVRQAGGTPGHTGAIARGFARLQTELVQAASTDATLKAMRLVEEHLLADYRALASEAEGLTQLAAEHLVLRTDGHWHVLTAHIARRSDTPGEEAARLPFPLEQYLAHEEPRVCMRCLLDRPGAGAPLAREKPVTYVCRGCHDDVVASFPPDLRSQMGRWPESQREDKITERAISRPSKETARKTVLAALSGHPPKSRQRLSESIEPDLARGSAATLKRGEKLGRGAVDSESALAREGATESELAYTDLLFDYWSVRASW